MNIDEKYLRHMVDNSPELSSYNICIDDNKKTIGATLVFDSNKVIEINNLENFITALKVKENITYNDVVKYLVLEKL